MEQIKIESRDLTGGVYGLKLEGSLDWSNFSKVEEAIQSIFRKGVYRIVVDLSETRYISSAGFGCFISSLNTAKEHSGEIVFASTPKEIYDVFHILGLSKILRFAENEKTALTLLK